MVSRIAAPDRAVKSRPTFPRPDPARLGAKRSNRGWNKKSQRPRETSHGRVGLCGLPNRLPTDASF